MISFTLLYFRLIFYILCKTNTLLNSNCLKLMKITPFIFLFDYILGCFFFYFFSFQKCTVMNDKLQDKWNIGHMLLFTSFIKRNMSYSKLMISIIIKGIRPILIDKFHYKGNIRYLIYIKLH